MDIATIIAIATIGIQVLSTLFMAVVFCVIKFNDMKHLEDKVDKLGEKVDTLYTIIHNLVEKTAKIEGKLEG